MRGNPLYSLNMNHVTARLDRFWILLDNQSTVNVFWNTQFLINVRKTTKTLELHTNAGSTKINEVGELPGVGTVWVHREGIANILSFHSLQEINGFEIDYSSRPNEHGIRDKAFRVESPEHIHHRFIPDGRGLYYMDCSSYFGYDQPNTVFGSNIIVTESQLTGTKRTTGTSLELHDEEIATVEKNESKFTKRDVLKAKAVRRFQHIAGHPSDKTLLAMVTKRTLKNVPFAPRDIKLANKILGQSVYALKGKRTVRKPDAVDTPDMVPLPKSIEENYSEIVLEGDVLHVNKIPFLGTISRNIHYSTIKALPSMTLKHLENGLTGVIKSYRIRGFTVIAIYLDMQFDGLRERMKDIVKINIVSKQEHVPAIERLFRTAQERARAAYAMLPFEKVPRKMIVELMDKTAFDLNAFPWVDGVSQELPPFTIVEGIVLDYNLHFPVIFGEYAQTYEGTDNTLKERTVGAIALGPSGNLQGGIKLFSLDSGEILHRQKHDYHLLPMPRDVIKRVNRMARKSRADLSFTDRHNDPFPNDDDDPDDPDWNPNEEPDVIDVEPDEDDDDAIETAANANTDVDPNSDTPPDIDTTGVTAPDFETTGVIDDTSDDNIEATGVLDDDFDNNIETTGVEQPDAGDTSVHDQDGDKDDEQTSDREATPINDTPESESDEEDDEDQELLPTTRSGRTVRTTQDDDFVYTTIGSKPIPIGCKPSLTKKAEVDTEQCQQKIRALSPDEQKEFLLTLQFMEAADMRPNLLLEYAFNQMNVAQGIKKYGEAGRASAMKEINNLVDRDCFGEVDYDTLTPQQKRMALPVLMFMVMKRDQTLKTRGCADGRMQRLWTNKADVSSPTPAIECIKYIFAMIAKEKRHVASFDLPAQFLQTDMDELLHLRISGTVALMLVQSDPDRWGKHLRKERGRPVIYVECKKAIYGTLSAAILAYRKLTSYLTQWGFEMNPYEPCVWNKQVKGSQMTVVFHVDDGIVSHVDPGEVTKFLKKLDEVYGQTDPLKINRHGSHDYLGMTVDFSTEGEVMITMYDYVQKLINKLPESMIGNRATAAPEYLFKTNDKDAKKLSKADADVYHTLTATTLYLSQRARPDLQLAVSFLCTRVKAPDEHDWKKLTHLMMYLQATKHFPMILRDDGSGTVIYMDGSHAVHADMKGHVGVYATEGKGAMYSSSNKLKLNTVSSTETELISVGEKLPKSLWYRLFRIAQGGSDKEDILMQDNQSAILLENNGRFSVGKGSKHIDIRYFFITDRIKKKHVMVKYCPTEEMIADFFTKPLQGALFHKFRNAILGIEGLDLQQYEALFQKTLKRFDLLESDTSTKAQECVGEQQNGRAKDGPDSAMRAGISERSPQNSVEPTPKEQAARVDSSNK